MAEITATMSVQEYNELLNKANRFDISDKELQGLCTNICNTMPVVWGWGNHGGLEDPKPWGCILSQDEGEWYCDTCPVTKICPHPNKQWSK